MELRHIRYFLAVAEEGSLNRAAQRLMLSQPTLSRQIHDLERMLGQRLVERGPHGVVLTSAGEALVHHGQQLLRLEASTRDVVASACQAPNTVIIGVPPTVSGQWFLTVIEALRQRIHDVSFRVFEAYSVEQLRVVHEGRLDIALVNQRPPRSLQQAKISAHRFGLAVAPGHPLADKDECRIDDLRGLRILARTSDQAPASYDLAIREIESAGVVALWEYTRFTEHARACAIAARVDAVFCGAYTARRQLPDWRWYPLSDLRTTMTLWLAWPRHTREPVARVASAMLAQEALRESTELHSAVTRGSPNAVRSAYRRR